jgi:hypothetical protein
VAILREQEGWKIWKSRSAIPDIEQFRGKMYDSHIIKELQSDSHPRNIGDAPISFPFPDILNFHSSLEAAVKLLDETTIRCIPYRVAKDAEDPLREIADSELKLQVGIMVARPAHGLARVSVERKYDR